MADESTTSVPKERRPGHLRFMLKGEPILDLVSKDISSRNREELLIKVAQPQTPVHFSLYPKHGGLGHHVTHEKYLKGNGRRHTQRGVISAKRLVNAFLLMIAPRDDPPPRVRSLVKMSEDQRLTAWFERALPLFIHPSGDRPVKVFKGVLAQLLNSLWNSQECDIDFTDLVENQSKLENIREEDWIMTIQEKELHHPDRPMGFSEDFSSLIAVLEGGLVMEFDMENMAVGAEIIAAEFNMEGYMKAAMRKSSPPQLSKPG
jgi:hypothetical protein